MTLARSRDDPQQSSSTHSRPRHCTSIPPASPSWCLDQTVRISDSRLLDLRGNAFDRIGLRLPSTPRHDATSDASLATPVFRTVAVVVTGFVDDNSAAQHIRQLQFRGYDSLIDARGIGRDCGQIALVSVTLRTLVGLLVFRVIVRTSSTAGFPLSILRRR